jgi:Cu-processing system permease protein
MGRQQIATLARLTILEAVRTRLMWVFIVVIALVFAAAYFIQQLAITESSRMLIAFSAAATRLAAVFVLSLYILVSLVREFNDKGLELTLSFDLRRADYILGRFLGFAMIALAMALIASLPQMLLAPLNAAMQWSLSLALELIIVTALSLFCILTFSQLTPAASFIAGFYVLARSMSAVRLISAHPILGADAPSNQLMAKLLEILSLVLPSLDRFTQGAWLVDGAAGWTVIMECALQALLYTALLIAAAMYDFYRRNL